MTYEVQKTKIILERVEPTFSDLVSKLGGYTSVLAAFLILADLFDDVQLYVVSEMLATQAEDNRNFLLKSGN